MRTSDVLSRNAALRCLGNSVVVPQAVAALRFLMGDLIPTHTVADVADADGPGLEGHGRLVERPGELPSPTGREHDHLETVSLSLSLSLADPAGERQQRDRNPRDRGPGSPDRYIPTPTAWLGRRDAHSKGDPARWTNPERSREVSDFIAWLTERTDE